MIRRVSRQILEQLGYAVHEAENGQEALARCQASMPDAILLDWNMPVMTGLEFVTALHHGFRRARDPRGPGRRRRRLCGQAVHS
jgi:two-component system, chemotaxis family, chemotaxis protein CheY